MTTAEIRPFVGAPLHSTFAKLTGQVDVDDLVADYRRRYADLMVTGSIVFDGIAPLLDDLRGTGTTLAVATSKAQALACALLDGLGLASFFDVVCGPVPPSREGKAETIGRVLDALGWPPPDTVTMVGDRHHDIEGAHAHSIRAVGVLWGFGSREELAGADALAESPAQLL